MAFATPVLTPFTNVYGQRCLYVTVAGTAIAAATEATLTLGHQFLTLLRIEGQLTSGTATTIDPAFGAATNPAADRNILTNGTAAAQVDMIPSNGFKAIASTTVAGIFYLRAVVDGGSADNVVAFQMYFRIGH